MPAFSTMIRPLVIALVFSLLVNVNRADEKPDAPEINRFIEIFKGMSARPLEPTSFIYKRGQSLVLRGTAESVNPVYDLVEELERSKRFMRVGPNIKTKLVKGKRQTEFIITAEPVKPERHTPPKALSLPPKKDVSSFCLRAIQECGEKTDVIILRQEPGETSPAGVTIDCAWEAPQENLFRFVEALPRHQDIPVTFTQLSLAQSRSADVKRWKGNFRVRFGQQPITPAPPPPPPKPIRRTSVEASQQIQAAYIEEYVKTLVALEMRLIELTHKYGTDHPDIQVVKMQIEAARASLEKVKQ